MERTPLTVTALSHQVKDLLEANFPRVLVQGEISNLSRAASGHVYMTLKDDRAQIRAIVWRLTASRLKFALQDGLEVVVSGRLEVYEPRGVYQLTVNHLQPQGLGALELAFRQMREKLAAEGLFAAERKRPIPSFPGRIAIITSPSGAAVRDILHVIDRRWKAAEIIIIPVPVQGAGAAQQIARALQDVAAIPRVEVVIVGRGGGSLEDLWAFNEEVVARAIVSCPIPVVSAVGHEVDVSIADLVADRRALTPSEAGELVVPLHDEVQADLQNRQARMQTALSDRIARLQLTLDALSQRPVMERPITLIRDREAALDALNERLTRCLRHQLEVGQQKIAACAASLDALSPLKVLQRGYSITRQPSMQTLLRSVSAVAPGDVLESMLSDGTIISQVQSVTPRALTDTSGSSMESDDDGEEISQGGAT